MPTASCSRHFFMWMRCRPGMMRARIALRWRRERWARDCGDAEVVALHGLVDEDVFAHATKASVGLPPGDPGSWRCAGSVMIFASPSRWLSKTAGRRAWASADGTASRAPA